MSELSAEPPMEDLDVREDLDDDLKAIDDAAEDVTEEESHQDPDDPFFVTKKAAAVLKHGILKSYLTPFVSKVGSTSTGKRVGLLDGYAGPGRYKDGTPGSPALLAETARSTASYRSVECHFVEENRKNYHRLVHFLELEGHGLKAQPYHGRVEEHLPAICERTRDIPLFAYLDPFGFGIPFGEVVKLLGRNPHGPPTEVLLNFTANGIRRVGGLLRPDRVMTARDEKNLLNADRACGDTWWRDLVIASNFEWDTAVEAVVTAYMKHVCASAGVRGFMLDVKNQAHHKPVYYLIFFTRHTDGSWLFNEAVSKGQEAWREHLAPPPPEVEPDVLFQVVRELTFEEREQRLADGWVKRIQANLEALLTENAQVHVGRQMSAVYEGVLGEAREMHVREAVKGLVKAGKAVATSWNSSGEPTDGGKGEVQKMTVSRPF
jgi:three-Cys-motif partner protein